MIKSAKAARILLVDDHAMIRESLSYKIEQQEDMQVISTAENAREAIREALNLKPDIMVMDIDMPGMICFDAARTILEAQPDIQLIFLSAFFHDHYIEQALAVKARGYVTKRESMNEIIEAIRAVTGGGTYFSEDVQSRLVINGDSVNLAESGRTRASTLTPRELEVLRYIARGMPKKAIAETMFLSVKTVENYSAKLMEKLDIHDRVELARYAIREGLAEA